MATAAVAMGRQPTGKTIQLGFGRKDSWPKLKTRKTRIHDLSHHVLSQGSTPPNHDGSDALMEGLLPLVKRVALEIRERLPAHVELDDLMGAGVLGVLDAARKFDAARNARLESYARYRIRGAILDGLRSWDSASRDVRKTSKKVEKVRRELEAQLGGPASEAEMAQALGLSLEKWYRVVREVQAVATDWRAPTDGSPAKLSRIETLVADDASPFDLCYQREQRELLDRAVLRLPERQRRVISLYYRQGLTMREIAAQLGVDESRVSQIHAGALARLRGRVQALLRPPQPSLGPAC